MIQSNALHIPLKDESVQCVITSPPYWGLRDYGTATWEGGKDGCDHSKPQGAGVVTSTLDGGKGNCNNNYAAKFLETCGKCGAKRIDNQLGLEKTPEEYVENTVKWAREVWRVLRKDGCFWLNLGDSYCHDRLSSPMQGDYSGNDSLYQRRADYIGGEMPKRTSETYKTKDLMGMPWKVVFALQADGWWLRSAMPWIKRNPMPESCTDRPASALEYMFLLTKSGTSQYWTNSRLGGTRQQPKPDYIWKHKETGEQVDVDQNDEDYKRINLWQGHDYYFDMTAIRKKKVDMDVINPYIKPNENIYGKTESGQTECLSEVQCEREGKSKNKRIQTVGSGKDFVQQMAAVGKGEGLHGQVQEDGKEKSRSDEIHQDGKILQNTKEVSDISEGERIAIKGSTQKTSESRELHKHIDGGGVGTNKRTAKSSVCDLQRKEEIDQGSHSTNQQGRSSRKGECSGSLPTMQHTEREQGVGRNFRNTDLFYQSLEEPHGAIFCGDEMVGLDVNPQAYSDAHFATFPEKLVEPLIKAGTSEKGACPECGAPWERMIETEHVGDNIGKRDDNPRKGIRGSGLARSPQTVAHKEFLGWQPTCKCYGEKEIACFKCGFVLYSLYENTNNNVQGVREEVSVSDLPKTEEILQSKMLEGTLKNTSGQKMSTVSKDVSASNDKTVVMQQKMFVNVDSQKQTKHEGMVQRLSRLHSDKQSKSSQCSKVGICDGTPDGDGDENRKTSKIDGSGSSHERKEGRQSTGKSKTNAEKRPRQNEESEIHGNLSVLPKGISLERECPSCGQELIRPSIVLDIFGGSGTTKNVADRLGRQGVICELKMEYIEMAKERCYQELSLF